MVKVRSSQKLFTDFEVSSLTGISLEDLRELARSRHLGFLSRAAEAAEQQAASLLFHAFRPDGADGSVPTIS